MQLRITDGTTTVDLAGATTGIRGSTYFPAPGDGLESVTESAEIIGAGTAAQIRAATANIEKLLDAARRRRKSGLGTRVFLEYKPVTGDDLYRSEIYGGRLVWSDDPGARQLRATSPVVRFALVVERAPWWEGPETELALSSQGYSAATGGRAFTNDGVNNWLQAATVAGTLPAPVKVEIVQSVAATVEWREFLMGMNTFGAPATFGHVLQAESQEAGYGTDSASAQASGGNLNTVAVDTTGAWKCMWIVPTTMTAAGGRWFRLVLRVFPAYQAKNMVIRAGIFDVTGLNQLWLGQPVTWNGSAELIDLGAAPIPPAPHLSGYGTVSLKLWMVLDTGTYDLGIDYLALLGTDSFRRASYMMANVAQNEALVIDDIEGAAYHLSGSTKSPYFLVKDGPLLVWPGQTNRYVQLMNTASSTSGIARTFTGKMWYRPRRSTV